MNLFLFFTLATVSSFSIRSFDALQILKDPRIFVSSIANADPDVVAQLVSYARDLIAEGEDVRNSVIQARNNADAAAAQAAAELEEAISSLNEANEDRDHATANFEAKTAQEATDRVIMDAAYVHFLDSSEIFENAQQTMTTELARIAQEDTDLKSVQVLLSDLLPSLIQKSLGRKLLSQDELSVDPAALQKVIDLVVALIEQGQVDAAAFTKSRDDAQDVLTAAIDDHNTKKNIHTHSLGAKEVARVLLDAATAKAKNAFDAKTAADSNKTSKDQLAADAEAHRDAEEKRIDTEKADFEKIIELLSELNQ